MNINSEIGVFIYHLRFHQKFYRILQFDVYLVAFTVGKVFSIIIDSSCGSIQLHIKLFVTFWIANNIQSDFILIQINNPPFSVRIRGHIYICSKNIICKLVHINNVVKIAYINALVPVSPCQYLTLSLTKNFSSFSEQVSTCQELFK